MTKFYELSDNGVTMRYFQILVILLMSGTSVAMEIPKSSGFDNRVQSVLYNPQDIAKINAQLGFVTTVVFSEGELVEKAITGFDAGWKVEIFRNKLFIQPVPVEQQFVENIDDEGDDVGVSSGMQKFAPIPAQWFTNLFVSTNKRNYNMILNIAAANDRHAHIVQYDYLEEKYHKKFLNHSFANARQGRNYDYFVKAGNSSQVIVPDFAYDDGEMTYFGFSPAKQLPSIFLLQNKKEQMINYSVSQQGDYRVLAIHNLSKSFVLRSGDMAAGILNKSFGGYVKPYSTTISTTVERVEADV